MNIVQIVFDGLWFEFSFVNYIFWRSFLYSALSFSFSLIILSCLLFSFLSCSDLNHLAWSSAFYILALYLSYKVLWCSSTLPSTPLFNICEALVTMSSSSLMNSSILSSNQGMTSSSITLFKGATRMPWSFKALIAFSLIPTKCFLASTLATNFWWACFLSSFLALYWIFLLLTSCLHLNSAASNLWASMSSAFLISSYSYFWDFIILSSSSSRTSILAYSKVLEQRTFNIGSTSESKSNSSQSPSSIWVYLQQSLDGIFGWKRGTGGLSK